MSDLDATRKMVADDIAKATVIGMHERQYQIIRERLEREFSDPGYNVFLAAVKREQDG